MIKRILTKLILSTVLFTAILCVCSCSKEENEVQKEENGSEYYIYYASDDCSKIYREKYELSNQETNDIINELVAALRKGNYKHAENPTFPQGIVANNRNGDILVIDFDEHYNELSGVEEALKRAAIVKTLCQIPEVSYVQFSINGQPLTINGQAIGNMSIDSFIDNVGEKADYTFDKELTLYYTNAYGTKLKKINTTVTDNGTHSIEELAILKLIEEPAKIGYYAVINPNTKINRIVVDEKKCYIDFSEEFLDKMSGISEEVVVYSVVNTLTELTTVNQVMITVNGEIYEFYGDEVDMTGFFERNFEINEERE